MEFSSTIRNQALLLNEAKAQTIALKNYSMDERTQFLKYARVQARKDESLIMARQLSAKDKEIEELKKTVTTLDIDSVVSNKDENEGHLLDLSLPVPVGIENDPSAYGSVNDDSKMYSYKETKIASESYLRGALDMLQRSQETQQKQINSDAVFPMSVVAAPTQTETITRPMQKLRITGDVKGEGESGIPVRDNQCPTVEFNT